MLNRFIRLDVDSAPQLQRPTISSRPCEEVTLQHSPAAIDPVKKEEKDATLLLKTVSPCLQPENIKYDKLFQDPVLSV